MKKPYEYLTTIGNFYEITVPDSNDFNKTVTIQGELRGFEYNERNGILDVIFWEIGYSRAESYYAGDILAVKLFYKPIPSEDMFFTPYKQRTVEIGELVDIYKNLNINNGYSIRCSKTEIVLAHCSSVHLKNARFVVSESGRIKTVQERRKRVHAYIRGELAAINVQIPKGFTKVCYNPFINDLFTEVGTNRHITASLDVICYGKHAYHSVGEFNVE